jgi:hypothetical protein
MTAQPSASGHHRVPGSTQAPKPHTSQNVGKTPPKRAPTREWRRPQGSTAHGGCTIYGNRRVTHRGDVHVDDAPEAALPHHALLQPRRARAHLAFQSCDRRRRGRVLKDLLAARRGSLCTAAGPAGCSAEPSSLAPACHHPRGPRRNSCGQRTAPFMASSAPSRSLQRTLPTP